MDIHVDGSHNHLSGLDAWALVTDHNGNDLIGPNKDLFDDIRLQYVLLPKGVHSYVGLARATNIKQQQINYGELLSLVMGLRIALKYPDKYNIVYSDSITALSWSEGRLQSKTRRGMDTLKLKYIDECISLRKKWKQMQDKKILKINGDDNKADAGLHKQKKSIKINSKKHSRDTLTFDDTNSNNPSKKIKIKI